MCDLQPCSGEFEDGTNEIPLVSLSPMVADKRLDMQKNQSQEPVFSLPIFGLIDPLKFQTLAFSGN